MQDEKLENVLNLALNVPQAEREKSLDLDVGYNEEAKTWDLIVRYTGDIRRLADESVQITELLGGYAIVTLPESEVRSFSWQPEIEYVEKPKGLTFAVANGRSVSCVNPLQSGSNSLFGAGVVIAVIDSGLDYWLEDFQNGMGESRILFLWDQTAVGTPPEGYHIGAEFTREQINEAIATGNRSLVPSQDFQNHGTPVTGIAAGRGSLGGNRYRGVAPESELIVVKLGNTGGGFPRTVELMEAVDYAVRKMLEQGFPMVINLSFGNTYGSHEGNSLLESYLNDISNLGKLSICVGSGNEGGSGGHVSGVLTNLPEGIGTGMGSTRVQLTIGEYETGLNLQIWKSYVDEFTIQLVTPRGERFGPFSSSQPVSRFFTEAAEIFVYYGVPIPYSTAQEIYLDFIPTDTYLESGIYLIELTPIRIVEGRFDMWLPSEAVLNRSTRFGSPMPDISLTIPSAAADVITVGAYDSYYLTYADFSGRGYTRITNQVKPDLVAPGVGIETIQAGGGYGPVTGTSFATPFVSGAAALLMEWGIVRGNDPYLYGEKLKAYLRRGAKPLPGFTEYPNPQVGYGALCVENSLPR
ncbi:MAG: S8 family peptidase [Lachnospiraceae bacterium]|nr:S8 family peptidase [Lachnospiraceae bacterium]